MIPHFKNEALTSCAGISFHACKIHEQIFFSEGFLCCPVGINSWIPSAILSILLLLSPSLKGLFKDRSSFWRSEVKPPGLKEEEDRCFLACGKLSQYHSHGLQRLYKQAGLFMTPRPPSRECHAFWIQTFICLKSIQSFSCTETTTPCMLLILRVVFLVIVTISFNLVPSPQHASTTVTQLFSFPVVWILMVFLPVLLIM